MSESEVRDFIIGLLREKLILFEISESEVKHGFDLVKSGLLDSMAFKQDIFDCPGTDVRATANNQVFLAASN